MKGTYGVKHFGGITMPQELSAKYQSNVDFRAELMVPSIFWLKSQCLEGYFNGKVKKNASHKDEWDDHKQQERTSWSKIYASFFKTFQLSRSTDMAPYAAGFTRHQIRVTGTNL